MAAAARKRHRQYPRIYFIIKCCKVFVNSLHPNNQRQMAEMLSPAPQNLGQVAHLPFFKSFLKKRVDFLPRWRYNKTRSRAERTREYAPVAQLDRVSDYESEGRGFESLPAHQEKQR